MKKIDWDDTDIAWHASRLRELLAEDPENAFARIKKEKTMRMKQQIDIPDIFKEQRG
jgi:hypothetical protein